MQIGYLRVSKGDHSQTTAPQKSALQAAGCERFFEDHMTGARWDRPQLLRALDQLRPDDIFVVWKLDRLSRSLKDLLHLMEQIEGKGAGFRSLTEAIDTTTPAGRMMMQMVGAFAEFEREIIRERTRAGLASARLEGRIGGRPHKLSSKQREELIRAVQEGRYSRAEAARLWNVHPSTVTRLLMLAEPLPARM
ncbi:recombinase family protein [Deinococcus ruber]|uniref:DNA-invertase n=1 Tax=Deinococcus ruber TaxID=1848197 RepID=A0A918KUX8_9DEIO|nr:recombinase family protein [Deinococcus ruber]GGR34575.1 DNA-invertase [Deinococcus ruber]